MQSHHFFLKRAANLQSIMLKKKYLSNRTKEQDTRLPPYLISFNDSRRIRWDVFVMVLTLFNCFYIPFEVAFIPPIIWGFEVFNYLINLIFYIDILILFRTTYLTPQGEEVTDSR